MTDIKKIGIIGGSGALGSALAHRFIKESFEVTIGSRSPEKLISKISESDKDLGVKNLKIQGITQTASESELIFLTVPFAGHQKTVHEIKPHVYGKIVVDTTVPLAPPKVARVQLPESGCVARKTQEILGNEVHVVSALHNVAATALAKSETPDGEVMVFGNNKEARETVIQLISKISLKGWHCGSIDNAVVAESLTPVLIFMNKFYSFKGSGIKIVDENMNE
ncbi:MAG: NADPH-dependent F420 reductase [Deltaproteobacteria bacterium]